MEIQYIITCIFLALAIIFLLTESEGAALALTILAFISQCVIGMDHAMQYQKLKEYEKYMIEREVGILQINEKTLEPEFVLLPKKE